MQMYVINYNTLTVTVIGSDNGLPCIRWQAVILTNVGLLSIALLGTTNVDEIWLKIQHFSLKKMRLERRLQYVGHFFLGLNVSGSSAPNQWVYIVLALPIM